MKGFKKILLPVDGSASSKLAKRKAMEIASAMEADILLTYITGTIPAFIKGQPLEEAVKSQQEEADQVLVPYRKFLMEHQIPHSEIVRPANSPGNEICKIAREENCDLIVMGSRGLGDLEELMIGSVTHRVLNPLRHPGAGRPLKTCPPRLVDHMPMGM